MRQLDWLRTDDVALLRRLVCERMPVSNRLGVASELPVFAFNAVNLPVWYAHELDALICYKQEDQTLRIFDVVAPKLPAWPALAAYLPRDATRIELCFCPDRFDIEITPQPSPGLGHGPLMVRGPFLADGQPLMFPRTAEC